MNNPPLTKLGYLNRIPLRSVWPDEARDFTAWLAKEQNLKSLSDAIQNDLCLIGTEERVGPFRADLVCSNQATGNIVIIENQLTASDHRHLGQIMTYAANLNAGSLVWIAEHFLPEHMASIDWLNGGTRDGLDFFAVEVELLQIDTSIPAPNFNVVCKPNAWKRRRVVTKKHSAISTGQSGCTECIQHLLDWVSSDERLLIPISVRDLIKVAANLEDHLPMRHAERVLACLGVRVEGRRQHAKVLIANKHPGLETVFSDTTWAGGEWKVAFKEAAGATLSSRTFNHVRARAVVVPISFLIPLTNSAPDGLP